MNLKGRNFLTLKDFTPEEITYLIDLAAELKAKKKAGELHEYYKGKNIALIFEKTSTSTHGEVVDHGCADDCHFYFGEDLVIVDGSAEVSVDPINEKLFFLDRPVRAGCEEFLTAAGKFFFGVTCRVERE